ncbi:hypothetical protein, partial [Klebsiella pneumoniae]|uniref:hypothetical protein n=2 Tax=Pseudomonadota TaxID=1224 RepID=UPI001952A56D
IEAGRPVPHCQPFPIAPESSMVTNDVYIIVRDAIQAAGEQSGKRYEAGQESHYQALAAMMALRKAGYEVTKRLDN